MRQTAGPHNLRPCAVVLRVAQHIKHAVLHGAHERLGDAVGQRHVLMHGEVAFHGVHHDVGSAGGGLIGRQGEGTLRIHNTEAAAAQVAVDAQFQTRFLVGYHAAVAHLAAGGRNGEHGTDGQASLRGILAEPEVPHITLIGHAVADSLRRVDHAASTYGQNEVDLFLAAKFDTFSHQREAGVGHHAAQHDIGYAGLLEQSLHLIEQTRAFGALTAVVNEHFLTAISLYELGHLLLRLFAENHLGRSIEIEIFHAVVIVVWVS